MVADLRARLDAAQKNVPVSSSHEAKGEPQNVPSVQNGQNVQSAPIQDDTGKVHLRFVGGGAPHRISGKISSKADLLGTPFGVGPDTLKATDHEIEVSFTTAQDAVVGVDLAIKPPSAQVTWQFYVDDAPLAEARVFAGPYGIVAKDVALGITTEDARARAQAEDLPLIDPRRDFGLFVTRERHGPQVLSGRDELTGEGADEMNHLLKEWGYAR